MNKSFLSSMIIRGPSEDDHLTQKKKNERSVDSLNNYASIIDKTHKR